MGIKQSNLQKKFNMENSFLNNIDGKTSILKQSILGLCINAGDFSIADMSKELNTSIPTITKLVGELMDEGFIVDMGKQGTNGGRRPNIYGLNPLAGYLAGCDINGDQISIAITDFNGKVLDHQEDIAFTFEGSEESAQALAELIRKTVDKLEIPKEKILACGVNLTGRVNHETGYCFSYFISEDKPLSSILSARLGCPVYVENDSRAMTYGEYIAGVCKNERNMLFINVGWGLGMGMIVEGQLSYGKSGFSGEIGHFPMLHNEQICRCGKTGCLETGASGSAAYRIFMEKLREGRASMLSDKYSRGEEITLDDILAAVQEEDVLAISTVEEIGQTLGIAIAGLINIFNPELVVIGGRMSVAKEYLLLPIKASVQKHSLNIVNKDTTIKFSKLGMKAGTIGACMLSRSRLLGLL